MADQDWFAGLYQSRYQRLVLMACALTNDLGEAEEIIQEAFALAHGRRARLTSADSAEAWIHAVAVKLAMRRRRREALLGWIPRRQTTKPAREAAVRQPAIDEVLARSRQRSIRRRSQWMAATAAVVVAAAIPLLHTQPEPAPTVPPPARAGTSYIDDIEFADERTGYALRGNCDAMGADCRLELLVTEDAARWRPLPLPDEYPMPRDGYRAERGLVRLLHVLGPRRVVLEGVAETALMRWYSNDAGRTWWRVSSPRDVELTMPFIPAGAILERRCPIPEYDCEYRDAIVIMLPESGRSARLTTPPPLRDPEPGRIPAADGGWWVSGKDPATGRWALAVSRDAGRTWSVSALPELAEDGSIRGVSVVAGQNVLYATATGLRSDIITGLYALFVSTDGGTSWSQTWQSGPGKDPRTINGDPVPEAGGGLRLVTSPGAILRSTDQGKTFEQQPEQWLGHVEWTRVGYLARNRYPANVFLRFDPLNKDATWAEITVG